MSEELKDYFDALDRLKSGRPIRVRRTAKINNANVAIEAGRKPGSIKRSRPVFDQLIQAISDAAASQSLKPRDVEAKLDDAKEEIKELRQQLREGLVREMSLYRELIEERKSRLGPGDMLPVNVVRLHPKGGEQDKRDS